MATHTANKLTAQVRSATGKGASRRARRDGKIPAVLYGHGTDSQHLEINAHDFAAVLRHAGTHALLALDIDGTEQLALTKSLSIHPIRRTIEHVDLLVVHRGEKIRMEVNVVIDGEATPGTLVTQDANTIDIEAEALSIPEKLIVSVTGVAEGTQITAGDIPLPKGVTLASNPDLLVVNIVPAPSAATMEAEGSRAGAEQADDATAGLAAPTAE